MAAAFTQGYTFAATKQVTNAKLHQLVTGAAITGIVNAECAAAMALANTKLANPYSYFTITICRDGQFTATTNPLAAFQMPFAATLVEVSCHARDIDRADANETYTIDIEEAGTSVLSSAISILADDVCYVGTISDASIADNAKIEVVLTCGGTSPAIDDITVLLTFKVLHCA